MSSIVLKCFYILLCFLGIFQTSFADSNNPFKAIDIKNPKEVKQFYTELQDEIRNSDIIGIDKKIAYPLAAKIGRKRIVVNNISELRLNYNIIFNNDVKSAILCQDYSELAAQSHGVMVGRGTLWFSLVFLKDKSEYNEEIHDDPDNRELWGLRITKINYGEITKQFLDECKNK